MPTADYDCIACQDCDAITLPTFDFDDCNPDTKESEIYQIYMSPDDPANPGLPKSGAIDWSAATPASITTLLAGADLTVIDVIGDLPEPEQNTRTISKRRKVSGVKKFAINATIDDVSDANYTAMRQLECSPIMRIWWATIGGRVYGGDNGVLVSISKANAPLDRGEDTYERIELMFDWEALCHPEREIDPFGPLYVGI